ncbi:hypothetical protein CRENBAI_007959 [Crenichthys baileyi]|uniref:Ig-like domain-containing protein n=1 Tax=Crenichthys baileyi TaxID=28760 RepID=A0AAV9SMS9_9TELE
MRNRSLSVLGLLSAVYPCLFLQLHTCLPATDRPRATITAGSTTIPVGGSVTLSCSVETSAGWKYRWLRRTSDTSEVEVRIDNEENRVISVTQGGIYRCVGVRGNSDFYTEISNEETIEIKFSNKVFVTQQPKRPQIFCGETITLTCEVQGGETTEWRYEWRRSGSFIYRTNIKDSPSEFLSPAVETTCVSVDAEMTGILQHSGVKPSHCQYQVFSGGTITLTCEVQGGETTEWTYEWRRSGTAVNQTHSKDWTFRVSESSSGDYMCQCRRRDDWYSSTQWSEAVTLSVSVTESVPVLLIVGPVIGVILFILLLLLCCYRQSKGLFCFRRTLSESSSRSSTNHGVNKAESHGYSSPLQDVTATYAEINHQTKAKRKRKGKDMNLSSSGQQCCHLNVLSEVKMGVTGRCVLVAADHQD